MAAAAGARRATIASLAPLRGGAIQENWSVDIDLEGGASAGRHALVLRTDAPSRRGRQPRPRPGVRPAEARPGRRRGRAGAALAVQRSRRHRPRLLPDAPRARRRRRPPDREGPVARRPARRAGGAAGAGAGPHPRRDAADGRAAGARPVLRFPDAGLDQSRPRSRPALSPLSRRARRSPPGPGMGPALAGAEQPAIPRDRADPSRTSAPATTWSTSTASPPSSIGSSPPGAIPCPISAGSAPNAGASAPTDREAGGIAARAPFYRGYEAASGRRIDPTAVHYWEVMAHVRWAVIALQQAARHLSGAQRSLELALTGRLLPELELEILESDRCRGGQGGLMTDKPDAAALLEEARRTLLEILLPLLPPERRYDGLMVANAMAIAAREAGQGDAALREAVQQLAALFPARRRYEREPPRPTVGTRSPARQRDPRRPVRRSRARVATPSATTCAARPSPASASATRRPCANCRAPARVSQRAFMPAEKNRSRAWCRGSVGWMEGV